MIGIINLNNLSSISRCHRDLRLCFGTDLHVTSKLETNFASNQCRCQFLADRKHVALLKSEKSFLSCVDGFPKFLLKQEVWTRYIEQLTISVLAKHSNKLLNGHIWTIYWSWLTSTCCTTSLAFTFVLFSALRRIFPELQWSCKQLIL